MRRPWPLSWQERSTGRAFRSFFIGEEVKTLFRPHHIKSALIIVVRVHKWILDLLAAIDW